MKLVCLHLVGFAEATSARVVTFDRGWLRPRNSGKSRFGCSSRLEKWILLRPRQGGSAETGHRNSRFMGKYLVNADAGESEVVTIVFVFRSWHC